MYKRSTISIILFIAGLGVGGTVLAGGRGIPTTPSPVIVKAAVDTTENVLIISGRHFGERPPTVLLADEALLVKRFSAREVVATLPRDLTTATYGITVITNHPRDRMASGPFSVTLSGNAGGNRLKGPSPLKSTNRKADI